MPHFRINFHLDMTFKSRLRWKWLIWNLTAFTRILLTFLSHIINWFTLLCPQLSLKNQGNYVGTLKSCFQGFSQIPMKRKKYVYISIFQIKQNYNVIDIRICSERKWGKSSWFSDFLQNYSKEPKLSFLETNNFLWVNTNLSKLRLKWLK